MSLWTIYSLFLTPKSRSKGKSQSKAGLSAGVALYWDSKLTGRLSQKGLVVADSVARHAYHDVKHLVWSCRMFQYICDRYVFTLCTSFSLNFWALKLLHVICFTFYYYTLYRLEIVLCIQQM